MAKKKTPNGAEATEIPRFGDYLADVEREEAGEWVTLDPPLAHVRVLLRSPFCADYQRRLGTLVRERLQQTAELDTGEHIELIKRAVADVALVSYEGLLDRNGDAIPYSETFVRRLMTERECHHYADAIVSAFQRLGTVKRREREAEGKGSAISFDTASPSPS